MAKQKEKDRSDISIEGNTAIWQCNKTASINGTYIGEFKFRCYLTPIQRITAGREYRELLGENPTLALKHDDDMAFALTQLKYRIISAPPFWTATLANSTYAGDIPDEEIIDLVLNAAIDSEIKYRNQLKKKKEESLEKAKKAAERMLTQNDEEETPEEPDGAGQG